MEELGGVMVDLEQVLPESCLTEKLILGETVLKALSLLSEENICSATHHVPQL